MNAYRAAHTVHLLSSITPPLRFAVSWDGRGFLSFRNGRMPKEEVQGLGEARENQRKSEAGAPVERVENGRAGYDSIP